jgi:succinate dehydrogenase/fumarate reductase flavoprotein subunit
MAAIRALDLNPELDVTIFEKADIKYSGSIARGMDALNVVVIPNFTSAELYLEHVTEICQGVVDAAPSYVMAKRSFDLLKELEAWGVHFPVDESGQYRTLQMGPKGSFLTTMEEPDLKIMVSRKAQEKGAKAINRVMGIQLLLDDGRVAGAIGLNVRNGELVVCQAKAVIITAGSQARFSLPNSGYLHGTFDCPANSGDSYAVAFRAGARLTGMESALRHLLIKDANMPLLAIAITRGGRLIDVFEKTLMQGEIRSFGIMEEVHEAGLGPLRIRTKDLPEESIKEIEEILFTTERPVQERFFRGRGVDFRKSDIELWPTEYQLCGGHGMSGIMIDQRAETGVPGLYAAGDAACVPKQYLTGAFVFGQIAAENAVAFIARNRNLKLDDASVKEAEKKRNHRRHAAGRFIPVQQLEYKVRRLISDYLVTPKNEHKLKRWLDWSHQFKDEIQDQVAVENANQLTRLYEVDHIVACADFNAMAALERKESRWGQAHRRADFQQRDDDNWLRHVVLQRGGDDREIVVSTSPVNRSID